MHAHLTNEELTNRLMGEPSMTIDAHLLECADCRREFNELKESIGLFRGAAQAWSEAARVVGGLSLGEIRWPLSRWVVAVVALVLMVILPALYLSRHRALPARAVVVPSVVSTQVQIDEDNQLLSEVNSEISEGVPAPMQPLQLSDSVSGSSSHAK